MVSGAKHCVKAAARQMGIKLDFLTLTSLGACVKPSSGELNHKVFAILTLGHRRCVPEVSYFPVTC